MASVRGIIWLILLTGLTSTAHAQAALDDDSIARMVAAGRYEELRSLEAAAGKGDAAAMYWWGTLRIYCIYGKCDDRPAQTLWPKAAALGHERTRAVAWGSAETTGQAENMLELYGPSVGEWESIARVGKLAELSLRSPTPKLSAAFIEESARLSSYDGTLYSAVQRVTETPMRTWEPELKALLDTGLPQASDNFVRMRLVVGHIPDKKLIDAAVAGDRALGVALCGAWSQRSETDRLPPALLPLCQQAASEGYPAAVAAMAAHHLAVGNIKAARFFAEACAKLLIFSCADTLSKVYVARNGVAGVDAAWREKAALYQVLSQVAGVDFGRLHWSQARYRAYKSMHVQGDLTLRTCVTAKRNADGKYEMSADCPWRKHIDIPAEFSARS